MTAALIFEFRIFVRVGNIFEYLKIRIIHLVAGLRDGPDGRAAAAQVQPLEEVGEGVLERRRDGGRREEVPPAEAFKIPGRDVTREIRNVILSLPGGQDGLHAEVLQRGAGGPLGFGRPWVAIQ